MSSLAGLSESELKPELIRWQALHLDDPELTIGLAYVWQEPGTRAWMLVRPDIRERIARECAEYFDCTYEFMGPLLVSFGVILTTHKELAAWVTDVREREEYRDGLLLMARYRRALVGE